MKDTLKKSTLLAAAAAMMAGMTACGPNVPVNGNVNGFGVRPGTVGNLSAPRAVRNGKKWTIFVHLAADNNLYRFGLDDVNEMEAGLGRNPAAAEAVDIIVLFDGTPKGDSKILRIKPEPGPVNSTIVSEVIDDKGIIIPASKEIDSGDARLAAKFLDWGTANFAAQNNMYVIWNHGSGVFRNSPTGDIGGGSFFDTVIGGGVTGQKVRGNTSRVFASDDSGTEMHTSDMTPILAAGTKNLGRPLDIMNFDACLMQHVEIAYQAKGGANILVASEDLEPGDGQAYHEYVGALAQNPDMNPVQLSKAMVDLYVKSYMPGGSQSGNPVTQAAVDVNQVVKTLVPALNEYAAALTASLPTEKAAISAARAQMQVFYNRDAGDLGDFVKKYSAVSRNPRMGAASGKLQAAIQQTVIANGSYGPKVANATGVQVYFPTATMNFNQRYADPNFMSFAETQGWGNFLKAFTAK